MTKLESVGKQSYLALRGDFILKVDGNRPILYPLDYKDTFVFFLMPIEGFLLSLVSGQRRLGEIEQLFQGFFPESQPDTVINTLNILNQLVINRPTASGIGREGLFEFSEHPIASVHRFDPRQFVLSPEEFAQSQANYQTKRRLETPISALLAFTFRCTTQCAYCYADRKSSKEMSLARWREIIGEMHGLGMRLCNPDNGDVFARKDGIDLLEILLEHEFHFLLSTKCGVSQEQVRRLVAAGFAKKINGLISRTIQLSMDAVDEAVQRKMYNTAPILPRTAATFQNFMNEGVMPRIKMVVTGWNVDQAKKLVDTFYPMGARNFHFTKYVRSFFNHDDALFLTPTGKEQFRTQFMQIQEQYPDLDALEDILPKEMAHRPATFDRQKFWDNRKGCGGGWISLGVTPEGKVFLCEQMTMDDHYFVGDLSRQSIMEVWQGEAMKKFIFPQQEQFAGTICQDCAGFEKCMWEQGRCYRDAYFSYGTIYDAPPLCPRNERPGLALSL